MKRRDLPLLLGLAGLLGVAAAQEAGAQEYPARTIRLIIPFAPGWRYFRSC